MLIEDAKACGFHRLDWGRMLAEWLATDPAETVRSLCLPAADIVSREFA